MCFMNLDYRRFRFTLATLFIFTSILLKNSSCHFHRPRFFRSESGCKDKAFLSFLPNLFRSFFKLFFRGPRLRDFPSSKIVVNTTRTPPPRELDSLFHPPLSRFSGCKDKVNIYPFPNFSTTFFQTFLIDAGIQTFRTRRARQEPTREAGGNGVSPLQYPDRHASRTLPNAFETSLIRMWYAFEPCLLPLFNGKTTGNGLPHSPHTRVRPGIH